VFTTLLDYENIRHRSAAAPPPGREHLRELRTRHPPSPPPRPASGSRRTVALLLALAARRIDRETARRAFA